MNKAITYWTIAISLLLIAGIIAINGQQAPISKLLSLKVRPVIYPYRINPETYPEYFRRPYKALTWEHFDNKPQFVAGRNLPGSKEEEADVSGRVYRPNISILNDPKLEDRLRYAKENNLIIHNIGGYGPGTPSEGGFGECIIPQKTIDLFEKYARDRFTGFDVGEQDGRFNFTYQYILEPYIPDRVRQYIDCQPYFDRVARDQGNWCSALSVLWYWHYILKEGYTILAGAETQNKITNGQVQYMHLRGAGKQYGILWYGDVSVFDPWGYKIYDPATGYKEVNSGGSLSLMKRSYYTQYMYNSVILSMESGWCEGKWAQNKGKLSPIGVMHNDCAAFVEKYGNPGVMVTQVALLNDFYSGWMPADHIAGRFRVWNGMDYEPGDFLTDGIISMFYPNYERSGFFHDETGAICETPYGENADALLSDARLETMKQYPVMVAAGDLFSGGMELASKIKSYVSDGGTFIVTARNAMRIWPEWNIGSRKQEILPGSEITMYTGQAIKEIGAYTVYDAGLPLEAVPIAALSGKPVAYVIPLGSGKVILSLTDYGLNTDALDFENPPVFHQNGFDRFLGRPYRLLSHFRHILDEVFRSVRLFDAGAGLGTIVNRQAEKKYRVAVYNNTRESLPFNIISYIGRIKHIKELPTGAKLFDMPGYWPNGLTGQTDGKDDKSHIFGGDIRIFDITLHSDNTLFQAEIPQPQPVHNRLLACKDLAYLKENIRTMPTFFDHFSGVAVDANALLTIDDDVLDKQNEWFKLQQLEIAADMRSGFNPENINKLQQKLTRLNGKKAMIYSPDGGQTQEYTIVDVDSDNWDDIYGKLKNRHTRRENRNRILALDKHCKSILKDISEIDCFFDSFGGVCVSAGYLANRTTEALLNEKKKLDEAGISVTVSLIEEINHFPGHTLCDAVPRYYQESMDYYRHVLDKAKALNIKTILFTTQSHIEMRYPEEKVQAKMIDTFGELTRYVQDSDIRIVLTNTRFRVSGTTKEQKKMIKQINSPVMALGVNLNHVFEDDLVTVLDEAGNQLHAIILGSPGSAHHSEYKALWQSNKETAPLKELEDILIIVSPYPFTNENIVRECRYMGWIK